MEVAGLLFAGKLIAGTIAATVTAYGSYKVVEKITHKNREKTDQNEPISSNPNQTDDLSLSILEDLERQEQERLQRGTDSIREGLDQFHRFEEERFRQAVQQRKTNEESAKCSGEGRGDSRYD